MSQSPTPRQDRIRVSQACENCREKKSKCDGSRPVCSRCQSKGMDCQYGVTKRIKNQQVMKELATKVAQYESILKRNIPPQQRVQEQSRPIPFALQTTSSLAVTETTSAASSVTPNDSSFGHSTIYPSSSVSRQTSETITPINNVVSNITMDMGARNTLDDHLIPPRPILEQATQAYLEGTALLFTFFDDEEIPILFERLYSPVSEHPSKTALIQLCAIAAVGCQHFPQRFDPTTRQTFVSIAKLNLEELVEAGSLPAIRILATLAMYYTFEKRTASLMYVDMGLRLGRMNSTRTMLQTQPPTVWQRVFGSLIFLDCWLCSTTGHSPSSQNRELRSAMTIMAPASASIDTKVQQEMLRIAVLSSSILEDVYQARFVSTLTINSYKNQLQQWLLALPDFMRLDYLFNVDKHTAYFRPVFLVHLMYMCAVILVYRRVLVELSCLGRRWSDIEVLHQTKDFLEPCLWTGRQIAKMLEIALSQGYVLQKSWMFIYASYSTCNVLLYFVASRIAQGDDTEDIRNDFIAVRHCIDVLKYCGMEDETASEYCSNASLIFDRILRVHAAMGHPKTEDEARATEEQLGTLVYISASFLIHPFDGGYRREVENLRNTFLDPDQNMSQSSADQGQADTTALPSDAETSERDNTTSVFLNDFFRNKGFMGERKDRGKSRALDHGSGILSLLSPHGVLFGS